MGTDITAGEERVLRAMCESHAPLGIAALGLSRSLGVSRNQVSATATNLERKGYCTRERVGVRIYLHPTAAGLAFIACRSHDDAHPSGRRMQAAQDRH